MGTKYECENGYTRPGAVFGCCSKCSRGHYMLQSGTTQTPQASTPASILPKNSGSNASVRRFEKLPLWQEIRIAYRYTCGYEYRNNYGANWQEGNNSSMQECVKELLSAGFKEMALPAVSAPIVASGYDPNDLQGIDYALWGTNSKPCCGGGINGGGLYVQGKWHDADCDSLKPVPQALLPGYSAPQTSIPQPTNLGRCTCGSTSVGSDRHSHYCDLATSGRR